MKLIIAFLFYPFLCDFSFGLSRDIAEKNTGGKEVAGITGVSDPRECWWLAQWTNLLKANTKPGKRQKNTGLAGLNWK